MEQWICFWKVPDMGLPSWYNEKRKVEGDIHGDPYEVIQFCDSKKLTEQDTLVLLGDVGANYYRNRRDTEMKKVLTAVKPTMLCIHGNHEIRPASLPSYRTKQWNGGTVWVEEAFPRLLFAMDGEIFNLEGLRHLVIGGAYSVDKFYRSPTLGHRRSLQRGQILPAGQRLRLVAG